MKNTLMAESYLKRAERRLRDAERALAEGFTPDAVRYSQECVEMALKGALRLVGVEYPKLHDPGPILQLHLDRLPQWFRGELPRMVEASRRLAKNRGAALYGDEERGIPPEDVFTAGFAQSAAEEARFTLEACRRLLKEWREAAGS